MDPQTLPAPAPGEPSGAPAPGGHPSPASPAPAAETFSREYVEQLRQEAAGYRTKLKKFEDDQTQAEQARLAESGQHKELAEQYAVRVKELEAEVAKRDHDALVARIARKHALPAELADRVRGATEAEIEADVQALVALLPKADPPAAPPPAPPGGGAPTNPARPPRPAAPAFDPKNPPRLTAPGLFKR